MTGATPRFHADPPEQVSSVEMEGLTILFHRPSGMTHVLAPPAPQIIALLQGGEMTTLDLKARLTERFELMGEDEALASRLEELVAAGLVERR